MKFWVNDFHARYNVLFLQNYQCREKWKINIYYSVMFSKYMNFTVLLQTFFAIVSQFSTMSAHVHNKLCFLGIRTNPNFFCLIYWLFRRFNAEDVYTEMCRKFIAGKFHDEKFPDKEPKDWFLFRNFKMELYDKEVGLHSSYFFSLRSQKYWVFILSRYLCLVDIYA